MTFSSGNLISAEFRGHVVNAIQNHGFALNPTKTRLMGPAIRREVTGLTVNQQVTIPRHKRRRMRAYFHQIALSPDQYVAERQRALGYARWLFDYHPLEGAKALEVANRIPVPEVRE
jgi:hypothetical protein